MSKLTELQKVLMGKGAVARTRPVDCTPWQGAVKPSVSPFNPQAVVENRRLYPHLFRG